MNLQITSHGEHEITPNDGAQVVITIEKGVNATVIERGSGTYTVEIVVHDNANLRYFSETHDVNVKRAALLMNDATITWVEAALGGGTAHVVSKLQGTGSDAAYKSVFLGTGDERYDIKTSMIHEGSHSTSNMLTRSVMLGKSNGMYEGLIKIDKDAQGCDAYQKEDTLLLSEQAKMHATPNLEISNEDVRCSHGVSLGQVDDEKLFYFLSRGINKKDAVKLIVQGFFGEILDDMGEHGTNVRAELLKRLEGAA